MALTARCPACTTLFKLVPDQLKVSDGWVRCGQCGEVFDAHAPSAASPKSGEAGTPSWPDGPVWTEAPLQPSQPAIHDTPAVPQAPMEATPAPDVWLLDPPAERAAGTSSPAIEWPHATGEIGFLSDAATPHAARRRRGMGWAVLVLVLVLLGQLVFMQRDRLAATVPALQPVLATLCGLARCVLAPVRQIESVLIDSSTFTQLRPDAYKLSFVLKNEAQIPLAMPALEVTLTDNQDRAVVRRVVPAVDFAPTEPALAAGREFAGTLLLGLSPDASTPRSTGIAGYRVLAFYP